MSRKKPSHNIKNHRSQPNFIPHNNRAQPNLHSSNAADDFLSTAGGNCKKNSCFFWQVVFTGFLINTVCQIIIIIVEHPQTTKQIWDWTTTDSRNASTMKTIFPWNTNEIGTWIMNLPWFSSPGCDMISLNIKPQRHFHLPRVVWRWWAWLP